MHLKLKPSFAAVNVSKHLKQTNNIIYFFKMIQLPGFGLQFVFPSL